MTRVVEVPFTYQPTVGDQVSVSFTGRVLSVHVDPLAPSEEGIMVTIELASSHDGLNSMDQHDSQRSFKTVATHGGVGERGG